MSIKLVSTGGGSVTIQEPNTASDFTLSVPSRTGNVMVDGPAFAVGKESIQSITGAVYTKVQFDNETFDTNSCYDNSTNYRFTPNVAGYYQINATVMLASTSSNLFVMIYKNGTAYSRGSFNVATASSYPTATTSNIVYCNGSTDYIEIYAYFFGTADVGGGALGAGFGYSSFTGAMVRGA